MLELLHGKCTFLPLNVYTYMWQVKGDYLFNLMKRQFYVKRYTAARVIIFFPALSSLDLFPPFSPAVIVWRLTYRGSSHFQKAWRPLLHYPMLLLLLQHYVGTGWYQLVPGEDRGRTGSVRIHRLSCGRICRRCASASAPATLPLINGPSHDNWS